MRGIVRNYWNYLKQNSIAWTEVEGDRMWIRFRRSGGLSNLGGEEKGGVRDDLRFPVYKTGRWCLWW